MATNNLCAKIDFLLALKGEENMISNLKKTREEVFQEPWSAQSIKKSIAGYRNGKTITTKMAKLWTKAAGLHVSILDTPLTEFVEMLLDIEKPTPALSKCREKASPFLNIYHARYSGYHYGWFQWPNDKDRNRSIYKVLVKVGDIVWDKNMISVKMTTKRHVKKFNSAIHKDKWGLTGRLLPLVSTDGMSLYFEHVDERSGLISATTILLGSGEPENGIWGIYTAEPARSQHYHSLPCASRFYMRKINLEEEKTEDNLIKEIGWLSAEDAKRDTGIDIFSNIINKYGVLDALPLS